MTITAPSRRPDVERAFSHIVGLAASADFSGATEPLQQWVVALRRIVERYGDIGEKPSIEDVRFTPVTANGVPPEWASAEGASAADRIVYVHGGGWSGGAPAYVRDFTGALARFTGASVLAVDYRLAPEHRFPAGLDDCGRALNWASTHGPAGAAPARSLALVGDSSGANLAVAACAEAIKNGARVPDRLAVIGPLLDNLATAERAGIDDPVCPPESLAAGIAVYLGSNVAAADPRISPIYESSEILSKFPPTQIQASSIEALLYDSRKFARLLEDAHVRVRLSVWPGLPHVWHHFTRLLPEAKEAIAEIAEFIKPPPSHR